jgi:putative tricarboxylic transport membrane protein
MMKKNLLVLAAAVMAVSMLAGCGTTGKSGLPKNIEVQVPAKAGGGTDVMARALTTQMSKDSGSTFTIVNNTDGAGLVAAEKVRKGKADGSEIMQWHTTMLIKTASGTYDKKAADDFRIIAVSQGTEKAQYCFLVGPNAGVKTLDEFIAKAKASELKIGVETGGTSHILAGLFAKAAGIKVKYVEAGSDTEKLTALVGGTIDGAFVNCNQAKQYVESNKAIGLAVLGNGEKDARSSVIPDIKNFQEQNIDCSFNLLNIFCGPKEMTEDTAKKIYDLYTKANDNADVQATLQKGGFAMKFLPYDQGQKAVAEQQKSMDSVVSELGLKK